MDNEDLPCPADVKERRTATALRAENAQFRHALRLIDKWAAEVHEHWDKDRDHKVGKHLAALCGWNRGYRDDLTAIREAIEAAKKMEANHDA